MLTKANRAAVRKSDPWDRVTANRFRHSLSLRERAGVRGRTSERCKTARDKAARTTMIYRRVLNKVGRGVTTPLDRK
ncbi:MAG: hypothetical protein KatS3mg105_3397 [Gemmatales bacterium]|nr:MAG: hypothetical protein KatS3mg105_3397 [Gemmatales bacterium]